MHSTRLCLVVIAAYNPKLYIHIYYHDGIVTLKIKDQSQNGQNRRSGEMASHIFETYKNYLM